MCNYNKFLLPIVIITVLLLAACSVALIAPYNANLVNSLNQMQRQVNLILINVKQNVGAPRASYTHYAAQYNTLQAILTTLISNTRAIPRSDITVKQLEILQNSITQLQHMHQRGFKNSRTVTIIQQTLNDDFMAVYRLQYAKKYYLPQQKLSRNK